MNTVRIAMVGVFVDRYGIEHAEGLSHFLEGWVVFITCVVLLFLIAWALLRLQRVPLGIGEAMDLDLTGLGPQLARLRLVRPSGALIAAALMVGGAAGLWLAAPEREGVIPEREPMALFPREVGDWRGETPRLLEPEMREVLGADDYYWTTFSAPDEAAPVDFLTAWYAKQTDENGIHSPEVCIPGGGWEMVTIETVDLADAAGTETPFPANRAIIQKGTSRQLVYFWFEHAGVRTAGFYAAKAQVLWNGLTLGRTDGALLRLVTPIGPKEDVAAAEARLQRFLRPAAELLPRFVPGADSGQRP
jgi:exosortase D (VPLPA-CTERM-specific)